MPPIPRVIVPYAKILSTPQTFPIKVMLTGEGITSWLGRFATPPAYTCREVLSDPRDEATSSCLLRM